MILVEDFLTDTAYRNQIERLRDTADPDEYNAIKSKLPCATISGLCEGSHANFRRHNGLICIDIDGKHNEHITDWIEFVHYLKLVPEIWYCGLSAGGKGCFLIIRIKYPAKHDEHFRNIEKFFRDRLDIIVDPQCININRLRYQSYNTPETSWFNHAAPVWKHRIKIEKKSATELPKGISNERVKQCVQRIVDNEIDITAGQNWLAIGCAFINEFGEFGRELFHDVSKFWTEIDPITKRVVKKYDPIETDKKYTYWMKRGYPYTIRTFFYICKGFGII
jgi:VirE N-terminal domain